jgi:hypothetical protein
MTCTGLPGSGEIDDINSCQQGGRHDRNRHPIQSPPVSARASRSAPWWVSWVVRFVAVVAVLGFIAHARHQSIPQMISSAGNWATQQLGSKHGLSARMQQAHQMPDITVAPTGGPLPATIRVTGTGYQAHEKVEVTAHVAVLSTARADDHGAFTTTIRVPKDEFCPHRQCQIKVSGKSSAKWTTTPYDLTD